MKFSFGKHQADRNSEAASFSVGRPQHEKKKEALLLLCDWLENQTDSYLYSLDELHKQLL